MPRTSKVLTFVLGLCTAGAGALAWEIHGGRAPSLGGSAAMASDGPAAAPALPGAPASFAPLVAAASPAVVSVYVSRTVELDQHPMLPGLPFFFGPTPDLPEGFRQEGTGSGFLISADGYILTNNHVVDGADEVKVELDSGLELNAKVVGSDPEIDVALVKVENKEALPFLELGSSEGLRVGDWVLAIGNPLDFDHTVTAGIVSAKGRILGATSYDDFIQTDASINPGNSGGPLLNVAGRVVGINTAVSRMGQGIAFAVPIDMVRDLIDDLKDDGRVSRGWLGISMQPVDADMAEALGLDEARGALVSVVHDGTPAEKSGLLPGDVILSLEGEALADSNALLHAVGRHRPGERVRLEVVRSGRPRAVEVVLGERPAQGDIARGAFGGRGGKDGEAGPEPAAAGQERLGVALQPGQVQERRGTVHPMVASVDHDGPASGKLEEGDLLLRVGDREVTTVAEAEAALADAPAVVLLSVQRRGNPIFVAVRLADR